MTTMLLLLLFLVSAYSQPTSRSYVWLRRSPKS